METRFMYANDAEKNIVYPIHREKASSPINANAVKESDQHSFINNLMVKVTTEINTWIKKGLTPTYWRLT